MVRKYVLNSEINIVSFVEEDILANINELTLVNEFDKDSLLIAISEKDFCNNIKDCHKNLILIKNNDIEDDASYINCLTSNYKEFAIKFIYEIIILFHKDNLISIQVSDFVESLSGSEVIFIKESGCSYKNVSYNLVKSLNRITKTNVKNVFINIYSTPKTTLKEVDALISSVRKEFKNDVNITFSMIDSDIKETSLLII